MGRLDLPKVCKSCGEDTPYGTSDYCYLCILLGDVPDGEPCPFCLYVANDLDDLAEHLTRDHGMVVADD